MRAGKLVPHDRDHSCACLTYARAHSLGQFVMLGPVGVTTYILRDGLRGVPPARVVDAASAQMAPPSVVLQVLTRSSNTITADSASAHIAANPLTLEICEPGRILLPAKRVQSSTGRCDGVRGNSKLAITSTS